MSGTTWLTTTREGGDGKLHLSCADTAKLVRAALKAAFPGSKFSVRSSHYSGGASIDVGWTDGPTTKQVDGVVQVYSGADFDGMIDLKSYNDHWIEDDGTVHLARAAGTERSLGSQPERIEDPRTPGARLVSFGADYVITQRRLSAETEAAIIEEIEHFTGETFNQNVSLPVSTHVDAERGGVLLSRDTHGNGSWGSSLIWQIGAQRDYSKPCECPPGSTYGAGRGSTRCTLCGKEVASAVG